MVMAEKRGKIGKEIEEILRMSLMQWTGEKDEDDKGKCIKVNLLRGQGD